MPLPKRKAEAAPVGALDAKKTKQSGNIMSFFGTPKSTSTNNSSSNNAPASYAASFDKAKWVAGLTAEQRQLLQLEINTLHESWLAYLRDEIITKEFLDLKRFLERETNAGRKWLPPPQDVYSWSRHTPFASVRVVVLGQDPYHNINQAHGLAFSVRPPTPAPPSLRNMFVCLARDYPSFCAPANKLGLLTPWADRGVLLLNTCLTVRAHEANSHANRGWEKFTQKIIDLVAARRTGGVVFMAWGTPAGKRVQRVDGHRHLVLRTVHPSPLSASRGFFECGHFRRANEWLAKRYGLAGRVDWALAEGATVFEKEVKDQKGGAAAVAGMVMMTAEPTKIVGLGGCGGGCAEFTADGNGNGTTKPSPSSAVAATAKAQTSSEAVEKENAAEAGSEPNTDTDTDKDGEDDGHDGDDATSLVGRV